MKSAAYLTRAFVGLGMICACVPEDAPDPLDEEVTAQDAAQDDDEDLLDAESLEGAEQNPGDEVHSPVRYDVSGCKKHFGYKTSIHGRLWSGSFTNCRSVTLHVRADLANGADPHDKTVAPGQTASWTNDPITGVGTTFRAWKACRYARCP